MTQQRLNPFTAGAQVGQRGDQVEARGGQVSGEHSVVRHAAMVQPRPLSTELQTPPEALSTALQLMESWLQDAKRAAGLNEGQVCAYIGNGKGGEYDPSQWNAARKAGNLPLGRMLAGLPDVYLRTFAACFATACGLRVSHADMADLAYERTAVAFEAVADAFRHLQRRAG